MSVNFPIHGSAVSMQPPICLICTGGDKPRIQLVQEGKGIRHWPYEGHVTKKRTETPCTESPAGDKRTGRPRKWASEAERLKAYRRRHGENQGETHNPQEGPSNENTHPQNSESGL